MPRSRGRPGEGCWVEEETGCACGRVVRMSETMVASLQAGHTPLDFLAESL